MKKTDVNRINSAAEHIRTAIIRLEMVYLHSDSWQSTKTRQHLDALRKEYVSLNRFADLMKRKPDFQHRDWYK